MTINEILKNIPLKGKTCGETVPDVGTPENWLDHAMEKMIQEADAKNDAFDAGKATALQAAVIALTLNEVDWSVIRNVLEAVESSGLL